MTDFLVAAGIECGAKRRAKISAASFYEVKRKLLLLSL